jgi:dihydroflavonol-4-reductase
MIHAAADTHIGVMPRPAQVQVNVDATLALSDLAQEQEARFVFVSSVDALPAGRADSLVNEETKGEEKYPCGYVRTKRAAEAALLAKMESGLSGTIVNPGFMLGPWDWKPSSGRMLLQVATRFAPFAPTGGFSVCDVRDVAAAIVRAATSTTDHRRYILAGRNMRYIEAWRMFARLTGRRGPLCPAGPLMRLIAGKWGDARARFSGTEGDVNSAGIGMSNLYHYYDSTRAQQELAYGVRPVEESVNDAWAWFQEHGYA